MFNPKQSTHDYMSLVLTHECNMSCAFCVDDYRGRNESITIPLVQRALAFATDCGIADILLIGGEPTLHPEVERIVGLVKDAGLRAIMTTNYTRPEIVRALDGRVDCFNISWYRQRALPVASAWKSDITLHALIHSQQLSTRAELDEFIDAHQTHGHLKFSTLSPCNGWAVQHQHVGYLDDLDCEWLILFDEIVGQRYRGAIIKRYDRLVNESAHQSYKAHVDGTISQSWKRPGVLTRIDLAVMGRTA